MDAGIVIRADEYEVRLRDTNPPEILNTIKHILELQTTIQVRKQQQEAEAAAAPTRRRGRPPRQAA